MPPVDPFLSLHINPLSYMIPAQALPRLAAFSLSLAPSLLFSVPPLSPHASLDLRRTTMDGSTSRAENRPHQNCKKMVRFGCDETEVDDLTPSLRSFLACDVPTNAGITTKPREPERAVEPSLQMVPYVPRGFAQDSTPSVANHDKQPLPFNLDEHQPELRGTSSLLQHIFVGDAGPSRGMGSEGDIFDYGPVSSLVRLRPSGFRAFRAQMDESEDTPVPKFRRHSPQQFPPKG